MDKLMKVSMRSFWIFMLVVGATGLTLDALRGRIIGWEALPSVIIVCVAIAGLSRTRPRSHGTEGNREPEGP
jgi:hypothetical protein